MAHLPTALTLAAATALAVAAPPRDASGPGQEGAGAAAARPPVQAVDVLLFEDSNAEFALGGFRERRRATDAPDVEEITSLFRGLELEVDARAPIVDLEDGSREAFERLDALRVDLEGTIGLVELPSFEPLGRDVIVERSPGDPIRLPDLGVTRLSGRCRAAGISALLIAPPEGRGAFALVDDLPERLESEGKVDGLALDALLDEALPPRERLPLVRVRRHELDLIRERLRARRTRGADGETRTIRVGPGPVEAHVVVSRRASAEAKRD